MNIRPYKLRNQIQHYAWGARNEKAFIPKLLGVDPVPDQPYAELWMGTHPNGPSAIDVNGRTVPLKEWIAQDPESILGRNTANRFNKGLPFLLKVLSAEQALSIQAHPNQSQAVQLHARDPQHYPDANHKPEIAIALDSLTALAGFRSSGDLNGALNRYPEITGFVGQKTSQAFLENPKGQMKQFFSEILSGAQSRPDRLQDAINELRNRLSESIHRDEHEILFLELRKRYPEPDIGLLILFLLNLIHLNPGEGIFLKAGLPHAYVKGNIVECMANSDNVVRAGLTPKFKDIETLTQILDYEQGHPEVIHPELDETHTRYQPPIPEFQLQRLILKSGQSLPVQMNRGMQFLLVIEGSFQIAWNQNQKESFQKGDSVFLPAIMQSYCILSETDCLLFIAEPGDKLKS